jgi:hypothetical protein
MYKNLEELETLSHLVNMWHWGYKNTYKVKSYNCQPNKSNSKQDDPVLST